MFKPENCAGCMACITACPQQAIHADEEGRVITDREKCTDCFKCVGECYYNARSASGKPYTPQSLFKELMKDEIAFRTSGGGVTLSGGEPMQHLAFCNELLAQLKGAGIHTAMETCGYARWEDFQAIQDKVDLFLYDIKLIDSEKHKIWTGGYNQAIMENATRLAQDGANIIIRVPLIPGVNDTEEEFRKISEFASALKNVSEMHILPFHQVGASKYDMVGKTYTLKDLEEENDQTIQMCRRIAERAGLRVSVGGTGFARS
jgi:pyruvate formate lyase activating enzyme